MFLHSDLNNRTLRSLLKNRDTVMGGNINLKIYGTLHCKSGKRMKKSSRVFFLSEAEAIEKGYRPCGNCMRDKYRIWKLRR